MAGPNTYDGVVKDLFSPSIEMFSKMAEAVGLKVEYIESEIIEKRYEDFKKGKTVLCLDFNHDYKWANYNNARMTASYRTPISVCITKSGANSVNSIALLKGSYHAYIAKQKKIRNVIYCNTITEILDLILNDKIDATYCYDYVANVFLSEIRYKLLVYSVDYDLLPKTAFSIGISKNVPTILVSILNKAGISYTGISPESSLTIATPKENKTRIVDLIYGAPELFLMIIGFLFIVLIIFLLLSLYSSAIRKKNKQLAEAANEKTNFLARMSHDIRTPLNGIKGYLDILHERSDLKDETGIESARVSANYLSTLINNVLDMSKIENGKMTLNKNHLYKDILEKILKLF